MKPLLLALFFALFTGNVTLAQHDTRAELNIRGGTEGIFVTPGERIWIATRSGDTYYTDHVMQPWHYGYFRSEEYGLNLENTFERVLFFDDLNGFISGFIYQWFVMILQPPDRMA